MRAKAALLLVLVSSGACAHFRVAPAAVSASTQEARRPVAVVGWGLREPVVTPANCHGQGIASVMVTIRPRDTLIAIVTLGLVRQAIVEWTCAKRPIEGAP